MTVQKRVEIGGIEIGEGDCKLTTVVGSCVAIMLYDKNKKIGGMIHIMLGYAKGKTDILSKYADTGIPYMIESMTMQGASPRRLLGAKIAGGGEMFDNFSPERNVARNNVIAVHEVCQKLGIQIIRSDCGDTSGRRVTFDLNTGKVLVEMTGRKDLIL